MNRHNLQKLADYLWALPDDYEGFDMGMFHPQFDNATVFSPECGTAACAVGHAPLAGIKPRRREEWHDYSHRTLIGGGDEWLWCFSAAWRGVDNTTKGAAKRIYWLLENGAAPNKYDDSTRTCRAAAPLYANQQPVKA